MQFGVEINRTFTAKPTTNNRKHRTRSKYYLRGRHTLILNLILKILSFNQIIEF